MSDLVERSDVIKMINRLIKDKDKCIVKSESFREGMVDGYCRVRNEMQYVPSIESSWIPVSDKHDNLPKGEVLACDEYGEMMFGYLSEEDGEVILNILNNNYSLLIFDGDTLLDKTNEHGVRPSSFTKQVKKGKEYPMS